VVFALATRFDLTEHRRRLASLLVHAAASYGLTLVYRLAYAGLMALFGALPGGFSLGTVIVNANTWVPKRRVGPHGHRCEGCSAHAGPA
jgi:two-component system LytT family sensor kinase